MLGLSFAGAESEYSESDAVIFGVPFDHTACFRSGSREAPAAVRNASYNFEPELFGFGGSVKVHDYGNLDDFLFPEDMMDEVRFALKPAVQDSKFTIMIGGEAFHYVPCGRMSQRCFRDLYRCSLGLPRGVHGYAVQSRLRNAQMR